MGSVSSLLKILVATKGYRTPWSPYSFQPFLRFWAAAATALWLSGVDMFQPFLRFWRMEPNQNQIPMALVFQPFLRFWVMRCAQIIEMCCRFVSTLLEILVVDRQVT